MKSLMHLVLLTITLAPMKVVANDYHDLDVDPNGPGYELIEIAYKLLNYKSAEELRSDLQNAEDRAGDPEEKHLCKLMKTYLPCAVVGQNDCTLKNTAEYGSFEVLAQAINKADKRDKRKLGELFRCGILRLQKKISTNWYYDCLGI